MLINFLPLHPSHFPLLLKWLETPHVKRWWDADIAWTQALIEEKYGDYVQGYKIMEGVAKPLKACIICVDEQLVGYIQLYNAHDFLPEATLTGLPESLGAFDVYIGEESCLQKGLGSQAIDQFLNTFGSAYASIFADPDRENIAAIRAYEKAGFQAVPNQPEGHEVWMLRPILCP